MVTITYIWKDGQTEQYRLGTKKQAEMMAIQLKKNELIANVIISDF